MVKKLEGLNFLHSLEPWRGTGEFSLDRMGLIMKALDNPQDKIRSVHVAGTNGKGSVSCAIASILGAAGYRVGLTTSPHLVSINERIVIDGLPISDESLDRSSQSVMQACRRIGVTPSFHEGITAIAFEACKHLDWMVVEVGLGGRLDSSNVLTLPKVAVITGIDYDHEHILGDTIELIASEKAGIVKAGGRVVVGLVPEEAFNVISRVVKEKGAVATFAGRDFESCVVSSEKLSPEKNSNRNRYIYRDSSGEVIEFKSNLNGLHQGQNMGVAIEAALSQEIPKDICVLGLSNAFWPGRLELLEVGKRKVLLDCAHNRQGTLSLISFLELNINSDFGSNGAGKVEIGFGALKTKRWMEMVDLLIPFVSRWNVLNSPSPMAVPSEQISMYLREKGIESEDFVGDYDRFLDVKSKEGEGLLLVAGSMYLVGAIRGRLHPLVRPLWKRAESSVEAATNADTQL